MDLNDIHVTLNKLIMECGLKPDEFKTTWTFDDEGSTVTMEYIPRGLVFTEPIPDEITSAAIFVFCRLITAIHYPLLMSPGNIVFITKSEQETVTVLRE